MPGKATCPASSPSRSSCWPGPPGASAAVLRECLKRGIPVVHMSGGGWFYDASAACATVRYNLYPDGRNRNLGFRLAR